MQPQYAIAHPQNICPTGQPLAQPLYATAHPQNICPTGHVFLPSQNSNTVENPLILRHVAAGQPQQPITAEEPIAGEGILTAGQLTYHYRTRTSCDSRTSWTF